MENKLTFKKGGIIHTPLNFFTMEDGKVVAIYQGSRGQRPELDFIVKYKKNIKTKLRAPSHTHWIVDLITKKNINQNLTLEFIKEWIILYEKIHPFQNQKERNSYVINYKNYFSKKYELLNSSDFSIEFVSTLLELFCKCEKQTQGAFMFKNLLILFRDYCEGKKDFYQIISYSKRV
jgi:hypothetical protein